ncbi:MAG TPA: hypothetical protein VK886_08755 [Vicinamibacterales bacterium]|nr:hypothetical protein [Vicinamibacterales bacterium]
MRFERLAAYSVGALLPIAEACRRRTDFSDIPAYVDDLLIGGLLLFAAWSGSSRPAAGRVLLVVAWAIFCGGMYYAFFGQLANRGPDDVSGLSNGVVVAVKGVLFVVGIAALIRSAQAAIREGRG